MIPKPEFGDYHKFRVSLAVAMVVAGPVVIWLFLRQPFDWLTTTSELAALTPLARRFIELRQWVSAIATMFSIMAGMALSWWGVNQLTTRLKNWEKIQEIHDDILRLEREHKKAGIRPQTVSEIAEANREEIRAAAEPPGEVVGPSTEGARPEIVTSPQEDTQPQTDHTLDVDALEYASLQAEFAKKLETYASDRYLILTHQSLRNLRYDLILRSRIPGSPDILIDVKVASSLTPSRGVGAAVYEYGLGANLYSTSVERDAKVLLIYILPDNYAARFITDEIQVRIAEVRNSGVVVQVHFVTKAALRGMDAEAVNHLLDSQDARIEFH